MKNTLKKSLALLMVIAMIAGLSACGNDSTTPSQQPSPPGSSTSPGTPPSGSDGGAETLRIGLLLNTTGWFAGNDLQAFYESNAIAEVINSQGGWDIGGKNYMIELVVSDIQSDFGNVNAAALYLIDQKVDFVIQTLDFFVASAAELFDRNGIMNICMMTTGNPDFPSPDYPHTFIAGLNGSVGQLEYGMKNLADNFPEVRTVIYAENDNGNNQATWELAKIAADKYGLELFTNYITYSGESPDMSAVALQLISSGADAVFTQGTPDAIGGMLKEVRNLGSDLIISMPGLISPTNIVAMVGQDAAYNYCNLFYSSAPEVNTEMFNKTLAKVGELYGSDVAQSFLGPWPSAIYILLNMMSAAGTTDVNSVMNTWRAATTVDTLYGRGLVGGALSYGMPGHAVGAPTSFMIMDRDGTVRYADRVETMIP